MLVSNLCQQAHTASVGQLPGRPAAPYFFSLNGDKMPLVEDLNGISGGGARPGAAPRDLAGVPDTK